MSVNPAIGAHVEQSRAVDEALARDFTLAQIFLGHPQSYKGPALNYEGGPAQLKADAAASGIGLYVHAPYIINVDSTNNRIRIPSRKLLQQHATAAAEIGALGLIVHGGHLGAGEDAAIGIENWRKAIAGIESDVPILIENTAGGDNAMSRHVDALGRLWEAVATASDVEVGFCLDTCHLHASGEPLDGAVERIRALTGRIDLVHLNDSRDAAGSGADRHENLGQGQIDPDALVQIVATAGAPLILETPGEVDAHRADADWLFGRLGLR